MTVIRVVDLRKAGVGTCERARAWAKRNGIEWSDLRQGKVTAEILRDKEEDGGYVERVISEAEKREANERRKKQ